MPFDATPDAEVTARDRMIRLRDFLATLPDERFAMRYLYSDGGGSCLREMSRAGECGTAACIAGWAGILAGADLSTFGIQHAAEFLGLNVAQAGNLFLPHFRSPGTVAADYTRARAVATLDHYLETGRIEWDRV